LEAGVRTPEMEDDQDGVEAERAETDNEDDGSEIKAPKRKQGKVTLRPLKNVTPTLIRGHVFS
jgi:hypothetical protein